MRNDLILAESTCLDFNPACKGSKSRSLATLDIFVYDHRVVRLKRQRLRSTFLYEQFYMLAMRRTAPAASSLRYTLSVYSPTKGFRIPLTGILSSNAGVDDSEVTKLELVCPSLYWPGKWQANFLWCLCTGGNASRGEKIH